MLFVAYIHGTITLSSSSLLLSNSHSPSPSPSPSKHSKINTGRMSCAAVVANPVALAFGMLSRGWRGLRTGRESLVGAEDVRGRRLTMNIEDNSNTNVKIFIGCNNPGMIFVFLSFYLCL